MLTLSISSSIQLVWGYWFDCDSNIDMRRTKPNTSFSLCQSCVCCFFCGKGIINSCIVFSSRKKLHQTRANFDVRNGQRKHKMHTYRSIIHLIRLTISCQDIVRRLNEKRSTRLGGGIEMSESSAVFMHALRRCSKPFAVRRRHEYWEMRTYCDAILTLKRNPNFIKTQLSIRFSTSFCLSVFCFVSSA